MILQRGAALAKALAAALLLIQGQTALAQHQHGLPFVEDADNPILQSFIRIINHSDRAGSVRIHAIDDSGQRFGPVSLSIGANATVHFNSQDLEHGNSDKGLSDGIGDGEGDWRLELDTGLDIEPLAYMRTAGGFLTSMGDVVQGELVPSIQGPGNPGDEIRHHVRTFNPASNRDKISQLRLINTAASEAVVVITGLDDRGNPPESEVRLTLPAHAARTITAQELEEGGPGLEGHFGDGAGKWQVFVSSPFFSSPSDAPDRFGRPLQVMSLMFSRSVGSMTNLSSAGVGNNPHRGSPGVDWLSGGGGDDVLNPGDNDLYDAIVGSTGDDRIVYTDSSATAAQSLSYSDLDTGIRAAIDGVANRATITKGSAGTDTIVDIVNPLEGNGFGLTGTDFDDRFTLALGADQWMDVRGRAGNDTIDVRSGSVRINYRWAPGPVSVDLGAGRASNDGYGNADTIIGDVWEVQGGPGDDTLRGSDGDDRLDGRGGDDVLDPGDNDFGSDTILGSTGDDRIIYSRSGSRAWQALRYDTSWTGHGILPAGIEATIDGPANRAMVDKGSAGTDTIVDIANPLGGNGFGLYATPDDDVFHLTVGDGQWMLVQGRGGNDTFNVDRRDGGGVRLDYRWASGPVNVDLGAGRASNDGNVDTINGNVSEIHGSDFKDMIRGSGNNESFIGGGGDDDIDGGGGADGVRFDRSKILGGVTVDLKEGFAEGVWDGRRFRYTLSNIERVRGGSGNDILEGSDGDNRLEGRDGRDILVAGEGNDRLTGGDDGDLFVIDGSGHHTIVDFSDADDDGIAIYDAEDYGLTRAADVIAAARQVDGGVRIDLSSYGLGSIFLQNYNIDNLDPGDILL